MEYKTFIAKALTIGIILNSIPVLSYANIEIPNRYQTLEGKYITINDSMEGKLEEIEIFGNTIQDDNNLEDIQSAGDLYVDEDGNPILDKQGREQYKLDIISSNSNLNYNNKFYKKSVGTFSIVDNGYKVEKNHNQVHLYYDIPLNGSTEVTVKAKLIEKSSSYNNSNAVLEWYIDGQWSGNRIRFQNDELNYTISIPKTISNSKILTVDIAILKDDFDYGYAVFDDISLAYGDTTNLPFEEPMEYKATILLPCQLQKIGNIADRLYWDNVKGRYVIEKNIEKIILNGSEPWVFQKTHEIVYTFQFYNDDFISDDWNKRTISTKFIGETGIVAFNTSDKECIATRYGNNMVLAINKDKIGESNQLKNFKLWLNNNNFDVYYQKNNSQTIDTNITYKIKAPFYKGQTYIFAETESGIIPSLKITIDRIQGIIQEAVNKAENEPTIYNLDIARNLVNQMEEGELKEQLQQRLNNISALNDLVLEKKNNTSNLDLYIKSENILIMSLSTNSITFEDFSGVEDMVKENAVQISINSSLPYSLNAYLPTEIQNSDKSNTMDKQILNIKENSESTYQTFANTTDKIVLKDNNSAGNDLIHGVDIKLKGGIAHEKDVYKTTIKFEAEQK